MKKIILIVGPSGVGKDSLIQAAASKLELNVIRRYITRIANENEDNYFIDKEDFDKLKSANFFISSWQAHGNSYGICETDILEGMNLISVSRGAIKDFENAYENVVTLYIDLGKEVLYKRLIKRGREDEEEIAKRMQRSYEKIEAKRLIKFYNDKAFEKSAEDFVRLLQSLEF